jgi:hypothetical protein
MNPVFNQQGKSDHHHVTADVPCRRRWCDLSADLLIVDGSLEGLRKASPRNRTEWCDGTLDGECGIRLHTICICVMRLRDTAPPSPAYVLLHHHQEDADQRSSALCCGIIILIYGDTSNRYIRLVPHVRLATPASSSEGP